MHSRRQCSGAQLWCTAADWLLRTANHGGGNSSDGDTGLQTLSLSPKTCSQPLQGWCVFAVE